MITIKIDNGKTYTVAREKMGVYHKLQQFINVGYLEEVKENKEYSSINEFCALNGISEEHRAILNTFLAIEHTKANSILGKLRADIEKRIEENSEGAEAGTEYAKGAYYAYKNIEVILTSLETPQFTPGQEIEVSHDGKNWTGETIYFKEYINGCYCDEYESWKFARPITQESTDIEDKIELTEVPKWNVSNYKWNVSNYKTGCTQNTPNEQIEALTKSHNAVVTELRKLIAKQN